MFSKDKSGDKSPTKEQAKQLNDEVDLRLEQDKGIHQRFAAVLDQYEQNPDLSFLRPIIEDQTLLVEKEEQTKEGTKKWVTFRKHSPMQSPAHSPSEHSVIENDNDDDEEQQLPQFNPMETEIIFEIKRNTELLLDLSKRQRDIQDKLAISYDQRDHDGVDNPKIEQFTRQLNDLIIPLQTLSVALGGLNINLRMVRDYDIRRTLDAHPNREIDNNNHNNVVEEVVPSWKRK